MITTIAIQALADALSVPDGGFTIDVVTGHRPRTGYMVSIFLERELILSNPVEAMDLIEYVTDHGDLLDEAGSYFGGWQDPATGRVHLDISVRVSTPERAARLANAHQQLAYFDLVVGQSIAVAPVLV